MSAAAHSSPFGCGQHDRDDNAGDTLIELLIALTIISIAFVGVIGGVVSAIGASGTHRAIANLDQVVQTVAEQARYDIELNPSGALYTQCASPSSYQVAAAYPASGPAGTVVTVFGSGFSGSTATVSGPASGIGTVSSGDATATDTIPTTAVAGAQTVTLTDTGGHLATTRFTVTPWVASLTHSTGPALTSVTAAVTGFAKSATLTAKVNGTTWGTGSTGSTTGSGTAAFTVPAGTAAGSYTVVISDGTNSASVAFTVTTVGTTAGVAITEVGIDTTSLSTYSVGISQILYWNGTAFTSTCSHAAANQIQELIVSGTAPGASDSINTDVADSNFVFPPPVVVVTVIGQQAGADVSSYVKANAGYYVYAEVTDTGPGIGSVTANVSNVTSGQTAVPLSSGTFTSPDGTNYNYRSSALLTSNSGQGDGAVNFTVNAADIQGSTSSYTNNGTVTFDSTSPTGSVFYTNGYQTSTSIAVALTSSDGTGSGVNSSDSQLERASASLANGACSSFGAFTLVATTSGPTYTDTGTSNSCYKYEYLLTDNVGNTATITSGNVVKVDSTPPTNSLVLSGQTGGGSFLNGSTLFYRGSTAGSFTLTNNVSDSGSGPASSTFPGLGAAAGWTSTAATVTTPSGGPYVSKPFSWSANTTSSPTESVTSADNAGNTSAATVLTFTNDSTAPTGTVTYPNTFITTTSVNVTFSATDNTGGSGVNTASGVTERASAPLAAGTCGAFSTFATIPASAGATGSYTDTVTDGSCYEYEYVVSDNVGNVGMITSTNVVKVGPTATITFPVNGAAYTGAKKAPTWTNAITGTTTAGPFAVTNVTVAIEDTTTGKWWNGTSFSAAAAVQIAAAGTTNWSLSFPYANLGTNGDSFTVQATATDSNGTSDSSSIVTFSQ